MLKEKIPVFLNSSLKGKDGNVPDFCVTTAFRIKHLRVFQTMTFPDLKYLVSSAECLEHKREDIRRPRGGKGRGLGGKPGVHGGRLFREDHRGREWNLTVWVTLAELLTEILRHDAGAGAVTGAVWMVTGLVVIHLSGRVI